MSRFGMSQLMIRRETENKNISFSAALARHGIYAELVNGCIRAWPNGLRFEPIDYEMKGDLRDLVISDAISIIVNFSIVFIIPMGGENEGKPMAYLQRYLMRRL